MLSLEKFKWLFYNCLLLAGITLTQACSSGTEIDIVGVGYMSPNVVVNAKYINASTNMEEVPEGITFTSPSLIVKAVSGGYEYTWDDWKNYKIGTELNAGSYTVIASVGNQFSEGVDSAWLYAEKTVEIKPGALENCELECMPANSLVNIDFSDAFCEAFGGGGVLLHSSGGGFVSFPSINARPAFIKSGNAVVILELPYGERIARIMADEVRNINPGYLYEISVDYVEENSGDTKKIIIDYKCESNKDKTIVITDALLKGDVCEVETQGFKSGEAIEVPEGCEPQSPVKVTIKGEGLSKLMLSVASASETFSGFTGEVDLLTNNSQKDKLESLGLAINKLENSTEVDFSGLIVSIVRNQLYPDSKFALYGVTQTGNVTEPVEINVVSTVPAVEAITPGKSIEGTNRAYVEIVTNANIERYGILELKQGNGEWEKARNVTKELIGTNHYRLTFDIPDGSSLYDARIMYMGRELCKFNVTRVSPEFSIKVDAFALQAIISVVCEDESLRRYLVENLCVFADDKPVGVTERDEENGSVTVTGLSESTKYVFKASIFPVPAPGNYVTPPVTAATEACLQLPNNGFEELEKGVTYKNLPSGGRFSQTIVPIFNMQNYVSYELNAPKKWANCNAKTFCKDSKIANSWYMQPSVYTVSDCYSGNYAVKIQSVGWDNNGEVIVDYLQEGQPYINYSKVIPEIAYRASGKLFLGEYSFVSSNNVETYTNGIKFNSRPSALNGYYKYSASRADLSDRGVVNVELTGLVNGAEVVIANGTGYFVPTGSYRAFTVDLQYRLQDVKAYKLKIMLASSEATGDINYETLNVKTYSNELTATSIGSELWIDELKLSY